MGTELPAIGWETFERYVAARRDRGEGGVDAVAARMLHAHYELLRVWNRRLSLIGPGTVADLLDRHFGESLCALPLLRPQDRTLVDVGTGGGFPGLVLAMVRRDLRVVLLEPNQRKWSFLRAAIRAADRLRRALEPAAAIWSCTSLDARIGPQLPAGLPTEIDVVTSRAVAMSPALLEPLVAHSPGVRILLWYGRGCPEHAGFEVGSTTRIRDSAHRQIITMVASGSG